MDSDEGGRGVAEREESLLTAARRLPTVRSGAIGRAARDLDTRLSARERLRLPGRAVRRIAVLGVVYVLGILAMTLVPGVQAGRPAGLFRPSVVLAALLFELLDAAAGMGFGTTLAPLLFILGYDPLQVTPVLLVTQTLTGVVSGGVHHTVRNVSFSFRPLNDATKLMVLFAVAGSAGSVVSIASTYVLFSIPTRYIETYVMLLVIAMGLLGLVRNLIPTETAYTPRRLTAFAVLAGVNKGIGGGGYGPVITLGQILSGVYEKSATAIASLAESVVSFVGVVAFLVIASRGVGLDVGLFPSIIAGSFVAAIVAPYLVRVVPNRVWSYLIPLYAFGIGLLGLALGLHA